MSNGKSRAGSRPPAAKGTGSSKPATPRAGGGAARNIRDIGEPAQDGISNKIKLNPEAPIPLEIANQGSVSSGGFRYIPFLEASDNLASVLIEARLLSTTHSACIGTKNKYLVGQGIGITNLKEGATPPPIFTDLVKKANARRQSMNRVFFRAFDAYNTWGNAPIEFVRGTKANGKPFVYMYAKNFRDCKLGMSEDSDEPDYVLVSKMFRAGGVFTKADDVKKIPLYRTDRAKPDDNWLKDGDVYRTIVWVKNEVAGYDYYGLPSAIASLIFQLLEYGGARYNLDNLDNNLVIGSAIFLTGSVTQTEADRIGSNIVRRHSGKGRIGRTAVYTSASGIDDVKHVQFDTHKDSSYDKLNEVCESKIILANDWDAVLAGLKHTSSLGKGGGYLKEIYEQKLKTVIMPLQQQMIEDVMPVFVEIAKLYLKEDWSSYTFGFAPIAVDNKTAEVSTTVQGLEAFLDIIGLVASGAYELAAAVQLVMAWYGISEKDAKARLGTIKNIGQNVRTKSSGKGGTNNPPGGTEEDLNQQ